MTIVFGSNLFWLLVIIVGLGTMLTRNIVRDRRDWQATTNDDLWEMVKSQRAGAWLAAIGELHKRGVDISGAYRLFLQRLRSKSNLHRVAAKAIIDQYYRTYTTTDESKIDRHSTR